MISLNLDALDIIEAKGVPVQLIRADKTIGEPKAIIDKTHGVFVACPIAAGVQPGDIVATDNTRLKVVRRVSANQIAAIWLCEPAPKPKTTGGK